MSAVRIHRSQGFWFGTLNQPQTRNALSPELIAGLVDLAAQVKADPQARALVLRGAGGFFCAGGSIGGFRESLAKDAGTDPAADPVVRNNRAFGHFMHTLATLPVPLLALVEGGAFGGGVGLACVADWVLATADARFALSETTLGVIPAQIGPFVVARIGAPATRRLGLGGERATGATAQALGLVDEVVADAAALDEAAARWLTRIGGCSPQANRAMKRLVDDCISGAPRDQVLDRAALAFGECLRGEGAEGTLAFREKRKPAWTVTLTADDVRAAFAPT